MTLLYAEHLVLVFSCSHQPTSCNDTTHCEEEDYASGKNTKVCVTIVLNCLEFPPAVNPIEQR